MNKDKTSIQISRKLKEKLESLGSKNDTYEEIIWELLNRGERR